MSILSQNGFAKGDKVSKGLEKGVISGMISSPRDEQPSKLTSYIQEVRTKQVDAIILFDPQLYISTLNDSEIRYGKLSEYPYYSEFKRLGRIDFSGKKIQTFVESAIGYQINELYNEVDYFISPNVSFQSFNESWSQIAISIAAQTVEFIKSNGKNRPTLITLVFASSALRDSEAMDEYLNILTTFDVNGFYVIVEGSLDDEIVLTNLLHFCYVLSELNGYDIILGYCDWHSFLLEAVGVKYCAVGWFQNLKQFSFNRFLPSMGGKRPRKRYSSLPLLTNILLDDLDELTRSRYIEKVRSETEFEQILSDSPKKNEFLWSDELACLHHWSNLTSLSYRINQFAKSKAKLKEVKHTISRTLGLISLLETELNLSIIDLENRQRSSRFNIWLSAIENFERKNSTTL